MYKHILIAIDESDLAFRALEQGVSLAKDLGAKVIVLTVAEPWSAVVVGEAAIGFPIDDYERSMEQWATSTLSRAEDVAAKAGVTCESIYLKDAHPADGILETAKTKNCDLIVMGSHGRRGLSRLLLGSQANRVVTQSPVPVRCRPGWARPAP